MKIALDNNSTLLINRSENPASPREYFRVWTWVSNYRNFNGDENADKSVLDFYFKNRTEEIYQDKDIIIVPVYAYIHSGISLSTKRFNDKWDSGIFAVAYLKKSENPERFDVISKELSIGINDLSLEVSELQDYLNGEVYSVERLDNESQESMHYCDDLYGFSACYDYVLSEYGIEISELDI